MHCFTSYVFCIGNMGQSFVGFISCIVLVVWLFSVLSVVTAMLVLCYFSWIFYCLAINLQSNLLVSVILYVLSLSSACTKIIKLY